MKIITLQIQPKLLVIATFVVSIIITSCDSDNNTDELVKAIELESQRAQGTIIESVTIIGGQTRLKAGEKHQLSATGVDSNNEARDITQELTWSSSDTSIATINNDGLVTAVSNSTVNQGIVTIIGSTINNITGETEMSISDVAVTAINLKQTSPSTGNINTCINANIKGDVSYEDGYISLNTVKNMSFTVDDSTSAMIDTDGNLYTSSEEIETTTINAKIGSVSGRLTVTADPKNLDTLDILLNDEKITLATLNVGERLIVSGQANLETDQSTKHNIKNTISWSQKDTSYSGITTLGDNKGTILALKPGVTTLVGSCGGKQATATLEVKGKANLDSIQINDGNDITLAPLESIELTLTANYTTTPTSLNVSEFAQWSVNGSNIFNTELIALGTDKASYKLTSTSTINGSAIISVTYGGIITSLNINVE